MDHTPILAIPYPAATDKAYLLATGLQAMAEGVENKIIAAGIPAVVNSATIVAPSAVARDTYFGIPATAAARRSLQDRGAIATRTDKGRTEQYFALPTDGGSNPGGALLPGGIKSQGIPKWERLPP